MQSIKKHKNKKPLIISLLVLVVLVVGVVVAYFFIFKPSSEKTKQPDTRPVNDISYSAATNEEKQDSELAKKNIVDASNSTTQNNNSALSITISRAATIKEKVNVRTIIDRTKKGTCTIKFTSDSNVVTKTVDVALDVNYYVCNIDVPTSELAASDKWELSATVKDGDKTSNVATQTVKL